MSTEIQTLSTLPGKLEQGDSTAEVQVHPSGKFLYGSNRGHNTIAVFAIDGTKGTLTAVEHASTRGKTPRNFGIDPTGAYLLAANQDVLLLAEAFLEDLGRTMARPADGISRDAREWLLAHTWPGNVRELRNAIERAILLCDGGLITREHLPATLGRPGAAPLGPDGDAAAPLPAGGVDLEEVERNLVERALRDAKGNKSRAARLLGLTRAQLYSRIEKYSLG